MMKILRLSRGIPGDLKKAATKIAINNAADLSAYHLTKDDPFLLFVQAGVAARLRYDFDLIENPYSEGGITTRDEAIFVLDESQTPAQLAGFATYKPRAPSYTSTTVVYIAVAKTYRGQGVFRAIMTELLKHYPAAAVDCPIRLVPLYEKFGFQVESSFSAHILMTSGPINGKILNISEQELMEKPAVKEAKQKIRARLGQRYKEGAVAFDQQNMVAMREAEAFVLSKKSS